MRRASTATATADTSVSPSPSPSPSRPSPHRDGIGEDAPVPFLTWSSVNVSNAVCGVGVFPSKFLVVVATPKALHSVTFAGTCRSTEFAHEVGAIATARDTLVVATTDGSVTETTMVEPGGTSGSRVQHIPGIKDQRVAGLAVNEDASVVAVAWEKGNGVWVRVGNGPWRSIMTHIERVQSLSVSTTIVAALDDKATAVFEFVRASVAAASLPTHAIDVRLSETGEPLVHYTDDTISVPRGGEARMFACRHDPACAVTCVSLSRDASTPVVGFACGDACIGDSLIPCALPGRVLHIATSDDGQFVVISTFACARAWFIANGSTTS